MSIIHKYRKLPFQAQHLFLKLLIKSNRASTLTNSITGVTTKIMVAILSGKNPTGVMILLPSPNTLPAQGGAVVGAAGVDGVHVRHQNLAESTFKADADIWDGRASPLFIAVERKIQSGFGKTTNHLAVSADLAMVHVRPGVFITLTFK